METLVVLIVNHRMVEKKEKIYEKKLQEKHDEKGEMNWKEKGIFRKSSRHLGYK